MKDCGGATDDGRVECSLSIGAHDHDHGDALPSQTVHPCQEGVDACPILVVHLLRRAGLRQRVRLVYDDDERRCRPLGPSRFASLREDVGEGIANERRHLADEPATTSG